MNQLDKLRDEKAGIRTKDVENSNFSELWKEGWNAHEALNLPVLFAKWLRNNFGLTDGEKSSVKWISVIYNVPSKDLYFPTDEELYQYWINNIYKPE